MNERDWKIRNLKRELNMLGYKSPKQSQIKCTIDLERAEEIQDELDWLMLDVNNRMNVRYTGGNKKYES